MINCVPSFLSGRHRGPPLRQRGVVVTCIQHPVTGQKDHQQATDAVEIAQSPVVCPRHPAMQSDTDKRQVTQVMNGPEGFLADALDQVEDYTGQHHQIQTDDTQSHPEGHEGAGKGDDKIHQAVIKEI